MTNQSNIASYDSAPPAPVNAASADYAAAGYPLANQRCSPSGLRPADQRAANARAARRSANVGHSVDWRARLSHDLPISRSLALEYDPRSVCSGNADRRKRPKPPMRDGRSLHELRSTYNQMIYRCHHPQCRGWKDYGGRGVSVCSRWLDEVTGFWAFVEDMGPRPPGMTLDRIDNDGDYTPENVRWATREQQARNTRKRRLFTSSDGRSMILRDWAAVSGLSHECLRHRVTKMGMCIDEAISIPSGIKRGRG